MRCEPDRGLLSQGALRVVIAQKISPFDQTENASKTSLTRTGSALVAS
jgi:hypothetical protein